MHCDIDEQVSCECDLGDYFGLDEDLIVTVDFRYRCWTESAEMHGAPCSWAECETEDEEYYVNGEKSSYKEIY